MSYSGGNHAAGPGHWCCSRKFPKILIIEVPPKEY